MLSGSYWNSLGLQSYMLKQCSCDRPNMNSTFNPLSALIIVSVIWIPLSSSAPVSSLFQSSLSCSFFNFSLSNMFLPEAWVCFCWKTSQGVGSVFFFLFFDMELQIVQKKEETLVHDSFSCVFYDGRPVWTSECINWLILLNSFGMSIVHQWEVLSAHTEALVVELSLMTGVKYFSSYPAHRVTLSLPCMSDGSLLSGTLSVFLFSACGFSHNNHHAALCCSITTTTSLAFI